MSIRLIPPCLDYQHSYCEYIDELGDEVRYPFTLDFDHSDFETLLQRLANHARGIGIPEGYSAHSTFWMVDGDQILGVSNLRHVLTDRLRQHGGHIGLGLRPSRRGQGLGRVLLALTIEQARLRGIGEIHIHCHRSNAASAAMIRSNGGVLVSEGVEDGSQEAIERYVIGMSQFDQGDPSSRSASS